MLVNSVISNFFGEFFIGGLGVCSKLVSMQKFMHGYIALGTWPCVQYLWHMKTDQCTSVLLLHKMSMLVHKK